MSYHFKADETTDQGLRRIAHEQTLKAIDVLDVAPLPMSAKIHDMRKRCKKVRGLLRLVRGSNTDLYDVENKRFREIAKTVSARRDATSMIEAFDKLIEGHEDKLNVASFAPAHAGLVRRRDEVRQESEDINVVVGELLAELKEGAKAIEDWSLPEADEEVAGFDLFRGGFVKTYADGQEAMEVALEKPTRGNIHEWRKRAKDHWYQVRLLRESWSVPMKSRRRATKRMADHLGDDRDLTLLRDTLTEQPEQFGGVDVVEIVIGLIDREHEQLRLRAMDVGRRLYAEEPESIADRFERYWMSWRESESRLPAEIAEFEDAVST
ncbi:CHAD domain protein [Planctomycetes bacterium Pan216]|uniref:CHAD domain protein n=1 Tax=Kolteria novifilia TaxID=2527975 RepID=A0A518BBD3_9BACT|nr:CHAD domain protein [Planctomycetes bacterium Pan216]